MLHDKHYPLPFCFMIDQSENLSAPVTDAWQIVYENELLCAMHSEGLQREDGMSHYDLFCAAYPILINGSTASQRFYAKAEKLGVCPANAPDRMWKEINRCLEVRPITLGQFRYTGGIPAFGVRSASQEELLARMTEQSDLLAPLHKILAHASASGLRVVRVVFGAHPFLHYRTRRNKPQTFGSGISPTAR